MPSSRQLDPRRKMFLSLAGQIESQLRDAYARKYAEGGATQSSLAKRLGVNRSAVHHRLTGQTNMTIETIADMVWALDHAIKVNIYDPLLERDDGVNYEPLHELDAKSRTPQKPNPTTSETKDKLELA